MSNDVNNLAHSFVAMAQAFERLPQVQAELEESRQLHKETLDATQRLELRLIDMKNELDAAHAATRKAEVERDHAETMFLETDDKLQKSLDVLKVVIGDANDFLRAVEPPKPEPEPVAEVKVGASEVDPFANEPQPTPTQVGEDVAYSYPPAEEAPHSTPPLVAPSWATPSFEQPTAPGASAVSGESAASSTMGENALPGYHNEPDFQDHAAWDKWVMRMNDHYGVGLWPSRYPDAAQ